MLTLIRKIIGNMTFPPEAEQCELGDWWVRFYGNIPSASIYPYGPYPFQYQAISQSYWGQWKRETKWLCRYHCLAEYRDDAKRINC